MRIGSVPYLNAKPLVWGLDPEMVTYEVPSKLAKMLKDGEIGCAMVSSVACFMNPELKNLREKPHLSSSSLSTFLSCSLQFKFSRIDKIPAKSKSSALLMGSVMHQVMEHF